MSDRPGFSRRRILELLAAVDAELPEGPPIEVPVGGAVAMMATRPERVSEDIDAYRASLEPDLQDAISAVTEREALDPGWFNNTPAQMGLPDFDLSPEPFYTGRRLIVRVMEPVTMLLLKLNAGRDKDLDDILVLMTDTGFTTEADLFMLIDSYFDEHPASNLDRAWMEITAAEMAGRHRAQHWGAELDIPDPSRLETPDPDGGVPESDDGRPGSLADDPLEW